MPEALEGLRVVEMTTALQGPSAAGYMTDMGASVTRIEPPEGDASRFHRGVDNYHPEGTPGGQFIMTSRGKRSVWLDIHTDMGMEVVLKLVDEADVFMSNYRESSLERLGLGYERLKARNPQIIYAVASGFGPAGPDSDRGMWDGAAQARGGAVAITGEPGGPPMMAGAAIGDTASGMMFALGIMSALVTRDRQGIAQKVNTSAYGTQIWIQMWEVIQSSITGHPLTRQGAHHSNIPGGYGVYHTADGSSLFLAFAQTEEAWQAFCDFGGIPEIGTDERWNTLQKRMGMGNDAEGRTAREVVPFIEKAFSSKTRSEWVEFLDSEPDIIYNAVFELTDVLNDPQAAANSYIVERDIPMAGRHKVVGPNVLLSETPGSVKDTIPELGQHTEEVMLELGFSWDEITQLNDQTREAVRQQFIALGLEPPY